MKLLEWDYEIPGSATAHRMELCSDGRLIMRLGEDGVRVEGLYGLGEQVAALLLWDIEPDRALVNRGTEAEEGAELPDALIFEAVSEEARGRMVRYVLTGHPLEAVRSGANSCSFCKRSFVEGNLASTGKGAFICATCARAAAELF